MSADPATEQDSGLSRALELAQRAERGDVSPNPLVGATIVRDGETMSHKFFVSFITWVSLLCVCLGVTALIVILSVMNGLEGELRERLLALSAHARIFVPAVHGRDARLAGARRPRARARPM